MSQLELEQINIDIRYQRFDELINELQSKLVQIGLEDYSFNDQAIGEKDSYMYHYENQLNALKMADGKLIFGALQYDDSKHYIGKIGLLDKEYKTLIVDWRANIGADFYQATPKDPRGIAFRRHIQLKDRIVTSIEDELFSVNNSTNLQPMLVGEAAIMAAMNENRTDKMHDIVATIQREQDEIIRLELAKCVIVQGGAGSGKTAVALHRIAYLLYEYRDAMANRNVLLIGPNQRFLNYIDSVLPSLGETGVVSQTIDEVCEFATSNTPYPSDEVRKIKGDLRMAEVIKNAANSLISIPNKPITISIAQNDIKVSPREIKELVRKAVKRTKKTGKFKQTIARENFVNLLVELSLEKFALVELDFQNPEVRDEYERDLRDNDDFNATVNRIWLAFEPVSFIQRLWSNEARLRFCAQNILSEEEIKLLLKPSRHGEIEPDDLALIDEAEAISGWFELKARKEREIILAKKEEIVNFAAEALGQGGVAESASHIVSAQYLANFVSGDEFNLQRLARYRHIVVDEAQELSQMQFRMLQRRSTNGSFTIVGDTAQTSSPAGVLNWGKSLMPIFENISLQKLTINYRNPREIADLATKVAKNSNLEIDEAKAVRDFDNSVKVFKVRQTEIQNKSQELFNMQPAVEKSQIVTNDNLHELKGLEFDNVILVEPNSFSNPRDLYVAMTRATKRLLIVTSDELKNWFN